ncbi:MAG: hypothetical protein QUV05_12815 [Phycisphaerae bacterium]|nr:hypothetical protein [Phycisphaerae bacterium]
MSEKRMMARHADSRSALPDFDGDQSGFAVFQQCYSGLDMPANPASNP